MIRNHPQVPGSPMPPARALGLIVWIALLGFVVLTVVGGGHGPGPGVGPTPGL
jgi:hypothetical protein